MGNTAWVKFVSVLMALVTPLSLMSADTGAMLYPQGNVTVNGANLSRSQAVFSGDRIQTFSNSAATITASGSSVQVAPLSDVVFADKALTVASGGTSVTTTTGLPGKLYNLTIEPARNARYQFGERDGQVVVAALEGAVKLSDGRTTMVVNPGKAMVAKLGPLPQNPPSTSGAAPAAQDQTNDRRNKSPAGGAVPAAGVGITLSKAQLLEIAGAAAVIGAVLVLVLTRKPKCKKNASPSNPSGTSC
jgi:hypothetical protein